MLKIRNDRECSPEEIEPPVHGHGAARGSAPPELGAESLHRLSRDLVALSDGDDGDERPRGNREKTGPRDAHGVPAPSNGMFTATDFEKRKQIWQMLAQIILFATTSCCVLPVVAILGYLVVKAWPALSWAFLFTNPENYFTAGGIWSPLIGTFFLVLCSLCVAAPIGILAGIYLNEYARQLGHPHHQPGRRQSGRGPQHCARLVWRRCVCVLHGDGPVAAGSGMYRGRHDFAGDYYQHA